MQFKGNYAFLSTMYGPPNTTDGVICLTQEEMTRLCADGLKQIFADERYRYGVQFSTAEHAYLCLRTTTMQDFMQIYNERNPYNAHKLSRSIKSRPNWSYYRTPALQTIMEEKFKQHPDQLEKLLAITEPIHNDIPYNDVYMGRNINTGQGQDMLGKTLRNIRNSYLEKKPFVERQKSLSLLTSFEEAIKDRIFYVMDTETTGFKDTDDIIELSILKVDGNTFAILDEFDSYINPGYKLPGRILAFNEYHNTGIDAEVIARAPSSQTVAQEAYDFMGNTPLLMGQNIAFDIKKTRKLFQEQLNIAFAPELVLDTLSLAQDKVDGSRKLGDLYAQIPNAPQMSFHRSIDDTKATLEVYKWLRQKYELSDKTTPIERIE